MAASKQTSIHTHVCNAVMLMWGSLKLAPIRRPYKVVVSWLDYAKVVKLSAPPVCKHVQDCQQMCKAIPKCT